MKSPIKNNRDIHGHLVILSDSKLNGVPQLESQRKLDRSNPLLNAGEFNVFDNSRAQRLVKRE